MIAISMSRSNRARCAQRRSSFARIRRLYYGAADPKGGAVENGVKFFASPTCHHRPEVYGGLAEAAASGLLKQNFSGGGAEQIAKLSRVFRPSPLRRSG